MAKRTHKEIIQGKIDKLEEQISKLQEKTVALQDQQDKLQEELKAADEEYHYWLVDKGWENDESCFKQGEQKGID